MATKNLTVPDIGAEAASVIEVLIKPNDKVKVDSSLITLESDKATMEIPSTDIGVIKEVKVKVGDKIKQGDVIALIEIENTSAIKKETPAIKENTEVPKEKLEIPQRTAEKPPVAAQVPTPKNTIEVHAGPSVRKIAREFGVLLNEVTATGPKERILKEDIQRFVKLRLSQAGSNTNLPQNPAVDFSKYGTIEKKELSKIKKISGKNLHRNWLLVPHVTQFAEADITELEAFRVQQKIKLEKDGIKLTPLVFIMKAVVACLKQFAQFNASLDETGENLIFKKYFHVGVAVDTPDGLVVPVIRDVEQKSLTELAKELQIMSEKARKKQLTPNDMQGGCFSISSLGGIGGTAFTPIVNVPEVAILGVSKAVVKAIYTHDQFTPRLMLPLSLSYDHRVIDGADGARFIVYLTTLLSDVRNLLL